MQPDLSILLSVFSDDLHENVIATGIALLVGFAIGRFLNHIIDRLPLMIHQAWDNYLAQANQTEMPHPKPVHLFSQLGQCVHCHSSLSLYTFIPVIGSLLHWRQCKRHVSWRYLTVDILTGLFSGIFIWVFGTGIAGLSSLLFIYFLIALCFIDAETMLLPDTLTLPLLWIGLIVNIDDTFTNTEDAIWGAVAGYLFFWLMHKLYKKSTGNDGIGYGDFKLLAALGAWLGWQILPLLILFAAIVGLLIGIIRILMHKQTKDSPMPFGPYLAISGILALLFGPTLLSILF